MSHTTSRRFFLGAATAAAAARVWGANDKINVGIVGVGGRGTNHLDIYSRLPDARVAAVCDVNQEARERAQTRVTRNGGEKPKDFEDMRQMFANGGVDVVSVATPNHWHALATIWAMKAGKDVYCEKPACYNVHEGQEMLKVMRETKKMVQIGSQHRSTPFKMKAFEALQGGLIGKIYMAKGLCFKRRPSIGHADDEPQPPAGLNWDLFLGPAPMRPYNRLRYKYNWHWFWDTGNGDIGNQGVHEIGICRWALGDPEWPKTAYAQGGKFVYTDDQETPNTLLASYDYGGRQIVFEVRGLLTNAEGAAVQRAPRASAAGAVAPPADSSSIKALPYTRPMNVQIGNLFFGSEGWGCMSDQGFQAFKGESNELIMEERPQTRAQGGVDPTHLHMENFLSACRSRNLKDLHDGLPNAFLSAGLCHLANISYRSGHKLTLETGPKFAGDAEANRLLTRPRYRAPYLV